MDLFHLRACQIHWKKNMEKIQIRLLESGGMSSAYRDIFLSSPFFEKQKNKSDTLEKKAPSKGRFNLRRMK
jgi:hypothetical protein